MINIKKFLVGTAASALMFGAMISPTFASYTLFDDASIVPGGNPGMAAQAVSDGSPGWGGVDFDDLNSSLFSSLSTLSTDFNVTDDNCGGGAPRFSINVDENGNDVQDAGDGNIFVYLGSAPNFNTCSQNTWILSGNLVTDPDLRWDTSQVGGTFYDSYANSVLLVGNKKIWGISLVVDAGWAVGGEQTVLFDNVNINGTVYDFEPQPVTVTIDKYIDGSKATATSANSSAFPMVATWNAINIGAGSGNFDLDADGFNGNPTPYQAITSEMTAGADYTTNEITGGPVVGADCTTGQPYALVGYTTGDTLSVAQGGTLSTSIPSFTNILSNKNVIVWNITCPATPINPFPVPAQCDQNIAYNKIEGTNGSNVINGTNGNDLILAKGGSDKVDGKGGDDCINGGAGSDLLIGGTGNDVILGGDGSDSIQGNNGLDKLYGEAGSDSLNGGADADQIWGGGSSDSLKGESGDDMLDGQAGIDFANGGTGSDSCTAEAQTQCSP